MEKSSINFKLEIEFENSVYDVVEEAIIATMKKYNYKQTEVIKLVDALYNGRYEYVTKDNDYRVQIKMLEDYFQKIYKHHLITLIIVKKILSIKDTKLYDVICNDMLRIEKKLTSDVLDVRSFYDNEEYDELMNLFETNNSLRYSMEVAYEKILKKEVNDENVL